MKLVFEQQEHQTRAVQAVVDVLEGLPKYEYDENSLATRTDGMEDVQPNTDETQWWDDEAWLDENVSKVQATNNVRPTVSNGIFLLRSFHSTFNNGDTLVGLPFEYPQFTISMETGTGKTYVYLKTIYALNERYGLRKFVIVVPSVAIYEGVKQSFAATKAHFSLSYKNVPHKMLEYDGNVTTLKNFAVHNGLAILLITIDSFNKVSNNVYKTTEKIMGGHLPIEYIQAARPVLMLDEVQNYQSPLSQRALRTLHPMLSVGYSATPGSNAPNVLYELTPFNALEIGLVKQIEIYGATEENNTAKANDFIGVKQLIDVKTAEMEIIMKEKENLRAVTMRVKVGQKLRSLTGNDAYGDLYISDISVKPNDRYLIMSDHRRINEGSGTIEGLNKEAVFRSMIRNTIQAHIEKQTYSQYNLFNQGVKVLTLFFVDRVASYVGDNAILPRIFDEEFESLKSQWDGFNGLSGSDVRAAYFASSSKKKSSEQDTANYIDTSIEDAKKTKEEKEAEKEAYRLIMKDKERLLSFDEKRCFIFAHSALREGWDNPNVFQICALREITTENNRRQTIGRGLRLPVKQNGERIVNDKRSNVLTVIANETYANYVSQLQTEYGVGSGRLTRFVKDANDKKVVTRDNKLYKSRRFNDIWNTLNHRTQYTINIDTDLFVREAIKRVNEHQFLHSKIVIEKGRYEVEYYTLTLTHVLTDQAMFDVEIKSSIGIVSKMSTMVKIGSNIKLNNVPQKLKKLVLVETDPETGTAKFDGIKDLLYLNTPVTDSDGKSVASTIETNEDAMYDAPKPNLLERVESEVTLTRKTIYEIFKGLDHTIQMEFIKYPESFLAQFIDILKKTYMHHLADKTDFTEVDSVEASYIYSDEDKDEFFPQTAKFPKKELRSGKKDVSLYDMVQVDSHVEEVFVDKCLNDNSDMHGFKVVAYFKLPPKCKIPMPRIIGNYNPDWAVLLEKPYSKKYEYLIRETKGTEDINKLFHEQEPCKIILAQKHFRALGIDYRMVSDTDKEWHEETTSDYPNLYEPIVKFGEPTE